MLSSSVPASQLTLKQLNGEGWRPCKVYKGNLSSLEDAMALWSQSLSRMWNRVRTKSLGLSLCYGLDPQSLVCLEGDYIMGCSSHQ